MKNCKKIKTCLACGNKNIKKILDLKKQPLANNFSKTKYKFDEEYPLIVNVCPKCIHLQLGHCVDPKLIYKNYIYFRSPIGKALIGKKKKELVTVKTPSGEKNFEITEVKYI